VSDHSTQNQIERLHRRVLMQTAPVMITATNDEGPIHRVQVRVNGTPEVIDNAGVMQIYGLASHAMPGTDATAMFVGGQRSNVVIVATGNQKYRMRELATGEVALYTDEGDYVKLARGKIVEIKCQNARIIASEKVRVESPRLECTGEIIDHCDEQGHTARNMREIYNTHTHPGIQPGGGHTGVPDQPQE
jgi:phage gp45-like